MGAKHEVIGIYDGSAAWITFACNLCGLFNKNVNLEMVLFQEKKWKIS